MSTNGINKDDADMAECDGEKVVTMMDVLQEQQDFEDDANAVLGASDDENCTYTKGYIKRQAIYACITCCSEAKEDPTKRAGVCLACSLNCHENHELIELYTKRNFRCDCGNPKFNSHPCTYVPNKTDLNIDNNYNQNFSGLYCVCHRPYPDPESTTEDEMIQCIICEDWLHSSHLEATVPSNDLYAEMVCKACMEKNEFLHDYSHLTVHVETGDVDVITVNGNNLNETDNDFNLQTPNRAKEDSVVDNKTMNGHDVNMIEELNNTDTIVPKDKSLLESFDSAINEKTDTKKDFVDIIIEADKTIETDSAKNTDVPIVTAQLDATETPTKDQDITKNSPQEANTVISEVVNENKETNEIACTKTDKEETSAIDNTTDFLTSAEFVQKNVKDKTNEGESESSATNKISTEENKVMNGVVESEENNITKETPDTDVDDETRKLETNKADLTKENLHNEEKSTVQNNTVEKKLLDEPEKIDQTPENDTACCRQVDENTLGPVTSNDNMNNSQSKASLEIKSHQISENAQVEVEEMDTLEAATKELSDMMEESNQGIATGSTEKILKDNYENIETQANDKSDNTQLIDKMKQDHTENIDNLPEIENKVSNERETEVNSLKDEKSKDSTNKTCETNLDGKICTGASVTEDKTEGVNEIQMTETNNTEPFDHEHKINNDSQSNVENEHKRKLDDSVELSTKRPKLDEGKNCIRPRGIKRIHEGATFWPAQFRQKICTCSECLSMYKDLSVLFLLDPEDTVTAYETLGKERIDGGPKTQYEKGLQALSSLDRIQQINALTEYNKMRDKLLDFLKSFKDRKEIVKEDDIKAFFAGMKPKREPDGVYFCR